MAYSKHKLVYANGVEVEQNLSDRAAADLADQVHPKGLVSITPLTKTKAPAKAKSAADSDADEGDS